MEPSYLKAALEEGKEERDGALLRVNDASWVAALGSVTLSRLNTGQRKLLLPCCA